VTDLETIRLAVYHSFAERGSPPTVAELAARLGAPDTEIREGLSALAEQRHVVLDGEGRIVMAHPFAAVPLGFSVMGNGVLWWGGCAWDSFALPRLLPEHGAMLVATRCPGCGAALAWNVGPDGPPAGAEVAHFLVPVARMWDDVVCTCANQRLFCSQGCVDAWLAQSGEQCGYVMDLATLYRLAEHWYDGRLEHGYVRRDPGAAADYFRAVGLDGPFWGL
jgi:alkylmercury lyase-like protein